MNEDAEPLRRLQTQLAAEEEQGSAPALARWDPPLCGDIDIEIRADGSWWHEGAPIRRAALVGLFASILRREADQHYYLVTPVEKWRLRVVDHALLVTDISAEPRNGGPHSGETQSGEPPRLRARCATGQSVLISEHYPLACLPGSAIPHVQFPHGLSGRLSRPVWYRLVEDWLSEDAEGRPGLRSGSYWFAL